LEEKESRLFKIEEVVAEAEREEVICLCGRLFFVGCFSELDALWSSLVLSNEDEEVLCPESISERPPFFEIVVSLLESWMGPSLSSGELAAAAFDSVGAVFKACTSTSLFRSRSPRTSSWSKTSPALCKSSNTQHTDRETK